jgi:hypothetical protein
VKNLVSGCEKSDLIYNQHDFILFLEVSVYFLLGIDDTDSAQTADTSALALHLGHQLEHKMLARLVNISSHQLLQSPSILHTGENVTCCLLLDADMDKTRDIDLVCREILHRESSPIANPGYALAAWNQFDPELVVWGKKAKINLLQRSDAISLARRCGISVAGINGSGAGVIGALAAIGLRYEGNDGCIRWMPGLDVLNGVYTQVQLSQFIHFDVIESEQHKRPAFDERILITPPIKPILKDGRICLPITAVKKENEYCWQVDKV